MNLGGRKNEQSERSVIAVAGELIEEEHGEMYEKEKKKKKTKREEKRRAQDASTSRSCPLRTISPPPTLPRAR